MRPTWEIIITFLAMLMSIFLMWFMFNNSAVVVAKGGAEALYGGGRSGGAGGGAGFSEYNEYNAPNINEHEIKFLTGEMLINR